MATLANLVIRLTTDTSAFEAGLKSAEGTLRSVGSAMTNIGQTASVGVTAPLLAAGGAALVLGKNFNEAMANVGALGVASDRVLELKGAVQSTAILVGESSQSMAQGLYQVISAFGDSAESADLLRINALAAKAGLATTAEAIALTSSVTKAYGDTSASAVGQVADLALQTVALGQTTFPELAASMGRVTPIAASMGVSLEELFGFMATFSGVTGSAAEVSTQLRGAMQSLMAPTETMQTLIGSLGFETGAAAVENLGLANVLRAVVAAADETGAPLQKYIGSIEGQTLALALAQGQSAAFDQKLIAMGQSAGMTAAAFAAQTQGVNAAGFTWDQVAIKAQVLAQRLWDGLAPAVNSVLQMVSPLVDRAGQLIDQFTQLDPRTQTIILGALALAAAFGPIAIVAGQVVTAIGAIIGVLSGLLGPLTLVIAAGAALYLAWQSNWLGIRDIVSGAVSAIIAYADQLRAAFETGGLQGVLIQLRATFLSLIPPETAAALANLRDRAIEIAGMISDFFAPTLDRLRSGFTEMLASLAPVGGQFTELGAAAGRLLQALEPIIALVGGALVAAFNLLLEIVAGVMPRIGDIISGVVSAITALIDGLAGVISGLVDLVVALVNGDWSAAWQAAQDIVFNIVDGITGVVQGLVKAVVALVEGLVDGVVNWFQNLYQTLVGGSIVPDLVREIIAWFTDLPRRVVALVADLVSSVISKFNDLKTQAINAISGLAASVADKFSDLKSQAISHASALASSVISKFNDLKSQAISHASALASSVISKFNDLKSQAISHASALASSVISKFNDLKSQAISHASALASSVISRFNDLKSQAISHASALAATVISHINNLKAQALAVIASFVSGFMGWLFNLRDQALALVAGLVASIVSAFSIDWSSIGSGIVNGVIGGVRAAAGALAAAAIQVVRDALAAARAALGIHSPSTVSAQEIGQPFTQGIAQGILDAVGWLVDAISTVAQNVSTAGVQEFASAVQAIVGAVGPALDAFITLSGWNMALDGLDAKMAAFAAFVGDLVDHIRAASDIITTEGLAAAQAFGEAAGPVIAIVAGGVEALVALGDLALVDGNRIDERMAAFADIIGGLTQHMRRVAAYFTADMLAAAVAFGETIGPITEPISQGVGALVALGDLAQVNGSRIDARMSAFADIMGGLTQHMRRVAAYFTADMLAAARAFGETIGPITEPIEQGVGALIALGDLAQVNGSRIDARMSAFADIMGSLTQHMRRVSAYFTADMLAAAVAFGEAIGPITEPIEQGVAALVALANAAWGDSVTLLARMVDFAIFMGNLASVMGTAAGYVEQATVAAAVRFADAVDQIVRPISTGVAALKTLSEASAGNSWDLLAKMIAFGGNMSLLAQVLANAGATISDQALQAARRFADFVADAKDIVASILEASAAMTNQGVVASANFLWAAGRIADNILNGMMQAAGLEGPAYGLPQIMAHITSSVIGAMWTISGAWQSIAWAGYLFGQNWVGQIINGITSRLHDLQVLLAYIRGLFPSSPAQYGAWRTLPDGAAVGGAFVGDLASALAPNGVQGALAGLHGLFGAMGAPTGAGPASAGSRNITITINNPLGEPTERSITRQMRNLAALGLVG